MSRHVNSPRTIILVGIALLALLGLTVAASTVDLGALNTVVAVGIAACKALLIILFFMEVRHSSRVTWAYVLAGFFWLLLLFGLTMGDYITRHWFPGK